MAACTSAKLRLTPGIEWASSSGIRTSNSPVLAFPPPSNACASSSLTSASLGQGHARSRVGADDAKGLVLGPSNLRKNAGREVAFPVVLMDDELGDPADLPALVLPSAGKCVPGEDAVDDGAYVGAACADG